MLIPQHKLRMRLAGCHGAMVPRTPHWAVARKKTQAILRNRPGGGGVLLQEFLFTRHHRLPVIVACRAGRDSVAMLVESRIQIVF